jgi:hypothetical protein
MTKRLIDLDDELLALAPRGLNTTWVSDTVRAALRQAANAAVRARQARSVPYTQAWNLAGFPAVAVRVGVRDGLPLCVQLVGQPVSEPLLLAVAACLEDAASRCGRPDEVARDRGGAPVVGPDRGLRSRLLSSAHAETTAP